jgi:N-acetyl-beta-hexosaminidase
MIRPLICLLLSSLSLSAALPALIPLPREVNEGSGRLVLASPCLIETASPADAARMIDVLRGNGIAVAKADGKTPAMIRLRRGGVKNPLGFPGAYQIEVGADHIDIVSADAGGFVHAAETLRQLMDGKSVARAHP